MSNSPELVIAITTVDTAERAEALAAELIRRRLAACVQIDGPITSHYVWEGKAERSAEWRLSIKSTEARLEDLQRAAHDQHPYSLPQWIVIRPADASAAYAEWVEQAVRPDPGISP